MPSETRPRRNSCRCLHRLRHLNTTSMKAIPNSPIKARLLTPLEDALLIVSNQMSRSYIKLSSPPSSLRTSRNYPSALSSPRMTRYLRRIIWTRIMTRSICAFYSNWATKDGQVRLCTRHSRHSLSNLEFALNSMIAMMESKKSQEVSVPISAPKAALSRNQQLVAAQSVPQDELRSLLCTTWGIKILGQVEDALSREPRIRNFRRATCLSPRIGRRPEPPQGQQRRSTCSLCLKDRKMLSLGGGG